MRAFAAVALVLGLVGCEKSKDAKSEDKQDDVTANAKPDDKAEAPSPQAAAKVDAAAAPVLAAPAVDAAAVAAATTTTTTLGAPECDELIARTRCTYATVPGDVMADAIKAFDDAVAAWKDGLGNETTRQAVIDACKLSLGYGKAGFDAVGCGGPDLGPLLAANATPAPTTTTTPVDAGAAPAVAAAPGSTGDPSCDALIERTMCAYKKAGSAMPADAIKAFEDSIGSWRDAIANPSTRAAVIDACKTSLDAASDGYKALGC